MHSSPSPADRLRIFTAKHLGAIPQLAGLSRDRRLAIEAVAAVLPFRVNGYVVDELIDWDRVPDDPIFQLTFPQEGMLEPEDFARMRAMIHGGASREHIAEAARAIQRTLNPHPAAQRELNVPRVDGRPLPGLQHKYRDTVLFFPAQGQTCHAYCTYCFRWAQFVHLDDLRFAHGEAGLLREYVLRHPEVRSVLFTGGDPLVMKTKVLARYVEALLDVPHLTSIRLGTKAVAYWPHRFVTDDDADDLLRLFERVASHGKHLSVMAHYSHPRELSTEIARAAAARILGAGAAIRCQAPLIRHVNDEAATWAELWTAQVRLGAVPYYMFVERDTGAKRYFEVPLGRALDVFEGAYRQVDGLARTVRGPSMSATPGKVRIVGRATLGVERVFALQFLQARDPDWVGRIFFARDDESATWLHDLEPAFGEREFFWEPGMRALEARLGARRPGALPLAPEGPYA